MKEELPINTPNLGGFPEKFKAEGIFVHGQERVKIGDFVEAVIDVEKGKIPKGTVLEIEDIAIEPRGNERGFDKWLKFKGIYGNFNPRKFRKIIAKKESK
jgi:hypothetical protein